MRKTAMLTESDLAGLAKHFRKQRGKSRSEAGRDLGVSHVSIHRAEENPEESLLKLRARMIEAYSPFKIVGPVFYLEKKQSTGKDANTSA
jgi:DNA-binding XRE family transcriptional regulator